LVMRPKLGLGTSEKFYYKIAQQNDNSILYTPKSSKKGY
jgi:hypothetical protein